DILLTKAECIMRGATPTLGATVNELVNVVRRCSNAPEVTENFTFQDLMDERSREFILEPWRRNDLIRCGMFENDWGQKNRYKVWDDADHTQSHWVDREGVKDPNRRLMPIHRGILETNLNWKQNPGYQGL
ncbi:MAG: RagB/SusD family nutrient uptake outer membrane protein, partial [Muribaculaceae bacterium]|nr:RagB/SusD family nutrient uptake outer membrane protein [Muribaculaceae bacterium]